MNTEEVFDPLTRFAEIEWLASKVYFRFPHVFLNHPELRDFWWKMAEEEEQHGSIVSACKALIENYEEEKLDPEISRDKAQELREGLSCYLERGTRALTVEDAFRIAARTSHQKAQSRAQPEFHWRRR